MGTSLFHNICCHLGLNWALSHLLMTLIYTSCFPWEILREIISTMFCLKDECSLHTGIKVVWQIYLWYISIAFYSVFLLSHDFKNSLLFIFFFKQNFKYKWDQTNSFKTVLTAFLPTCYLLHFASPSVLPTPAYTCSMVKWITVLWLPSSTLLQFQCINCVTSEHCGYSVWFLL